MLTNIDFDPFSMFRKSGMEIFVVGGLVTFRIHEPQGIKVQFNVEYTIDSKSKCDYRYHNNNHLYIAKALLNIVFVNIVPYSCNFI